jgi:3'-phosphoadenosine 5'-phosphosulfate sulfotransferase (PAPS reductase)/FAD synthetase
MADRLPIFQRTPDRAIAEAHEIVRAAKAEHRPTKTFLLFSGGNDSLVLLDAMAQHADAVVHVNTTISVRESNLFARRVGRSYGLPYIEGLPPESYRRLCLTHPVLKGMPGPGVHHIVYSRLKERVFEAVLRQHRRYRGERFLLLSGIRRAESPRRNAREVSAVDRKGGQVWVKPLLDWDNDEMFHYRKANDLPVNPVAQELHMSGECICGAMADQDHAREERAQLKFFRPAAERRIADIEEAVKRAELPYQEWGVKRAPDCKGIADELAGRGPTLFACQSCERRYEHLTDPEAAP